MDRVETVQQRLQWIMDHCINPATGRRWKGKPLSRAAGLASESHVSMILTGGIKEPKRVVLKGIADAVGVPLSWLADGEGDPPTLPTVSGAPRELRVELDPKPAIEAPANASPLVFAVTQALDKDRHLVTDAMLVISVLQNDIHQHLALEHDLIEKARVWLDAAAALRREGKPVTATTLLDRVTLGKTPLTPDEDDAFQREIAEIARKHGMTFGQGVAAIEAFQRGTKKPPAT